MLLSAPVSTLRTDVKNENNRLGKNFNASRLFGTMKIQKTIITFHF
jgi:hypothetical protein